MLAVWHELTRLETTFQPFSISETHRASRTLPHQIPEFQKSVLPDVSLIRRVSLHVQPAKDAPSLVLQQKLLSRFIPSYEVLICFVLSLNFGLTGASQPAPGHIRSFDYPSSAQQHSPKRILGTRALVQPLHATRTRTSTSVWLSVVALKGCN
ncbi:hypothetical protein VTK73DRAFT_4327 [Phialemonium thermophilum]|uniref:Uncharacterized protein n=1 Tax=Phialemonium thermophilum TaxID=223376 RepID=A0ABR3V9S6_9PEZI